MGRWSVLVLASIVATSLRAQSGSPRLELRLPDRIVANSDGPTTLINGVLAEGTRREALNAGWSTGIHGRLELWKKGAFGIFNRESVAEWDVVVEYAPASKIYHVRRLAGTRMDDIGEAKTIEDADALLRRPYQPGLSPQSKGGRYFYVFTIDVSTLSMSDLDAWQRWVRGEARPAVQGKRNPAAALQRGLGSLLSRVLGGETQTYETRSGTFSAG